MSLIGPATFKAKEFFFDREMATGFNVPEPLRLRFSNHLNIFLGMLKSTFIVLKMVDCRG